MEISYTRNLANGVDGSSSLDDAVAPGRSAYVWQVFFDRYQATTGSSPGHAQKGSGSRYLATARLIVRIRLSHGT